MATTNRKHKRNKVYCEVYRKINKRERNKIPKIARHVKAHPNDKPSKSRLDQLIKMF